MMKRICILIIILFSVPFLRAQVTVIAKTDRTSYLIGDYIRYELSAVIDSTIIINWPEPEIFSEFDLISSKPVDTILLQDKFQLKQEIVYSIYDPGNYVIPPVRIGYKKMKDTTFYAVSSDSIPLTILSVTVDTTQTIKPIKDIIIVKEKNYLLYYIIGGIVLLAGIGFAIYYFFYRTKPKVEPVVKIMPDSLYLEIRKKLEALESKKLWQKNELKQYYSELTDILREYMEKQFNMKAMESTSDEIIAQLNRLNIPSGQSENINYILELSDFAKFAKSRPSADENIRAMQLAIEFVEATKPVEQKEIKQ